MRSRIAIAAALLAAVSSTAPAAIRVLSPVSGIPSSSRYEVAISAARNGSYQNAHVHFTKENWTGSSDDFGYNFWLQGYRMSYVNFEFSQNAAWVRVRTPGRNIPNIEVRPKAKNTQVFYETLNGLRIAKIKIPAPTNAYLSRSFLSVVPIVNGNRQFDDALAVFANVFSQPPTNNIVNVFPGNSIPQAGGLSSGQTVIFKKGLHNIGANYFPKSGVNYYLENGAFVRGTFTDNANVNNVRIYGLGILSQSHLRRWINGVKQNNRTIFLTGNNIRIEGVTVEDPAHHGITVTGGSGTRNKIRDVKVLSWRANGDGLHITGNGDINDCFLRTQDDSCYAAAGMNNVKIDRVVTWNDFNGSAFIFTHGAGGKNAVIRNSDVIYSRSRFVRGSPGANTNNQWENYHGGSVFTLVGLSGNQVVDNITFDGIRIDDDAPSRSIISVRLQSSVFNTNAPAINANTKFRNVTFKNITAASQGGYSNVMLSELSSVYPQNVTFDNVRIGGQLLTNLNGWKTRNLRLGQFTFRGNGGGGGNLITNPGFENDLNQWSVWNNNAAAVGTRFSGNRGVRLGSAAGGCVCNPFEASPGNDYTVTARVVRYKTGGTAYVGIRFFNINGAIIGDNAVPIQGGNLGTWQLSTQTRTAPAGTVMADVYYWKPSGGQEFSFYGDAFSCTASP